MSRLSSDTKWACDRRRCCLSFALSCQAQQASRTSASLPPCHWNSKLELVKAQFASKGHVVVGGDNCDFIVVKIVWGHSRYCSDLAALIAFGKQLGVLA